ncbi:MAG: hypothetical protein HKN32_06070, partial [Flavobacteriales bacterium]|nr:hypothetical protein [Flavobacteriales bacterium]
MEASAAPLATSPPSQKPVEPKSKQTSYNPQEKSDQKGFTTGKKIKSAGISLVNLFDETGVAVDEGEEGENEEDTANDDFSNEEFVAAWKDFAKIQMEKDLMSLYTTLTAELPSCNDREIVLKVTNSVQQMDVDNVRGELMEFLRNRLNNGQLQLKTILVKDDSTKLKYYTDKDKFDAMKEKNPSLEYFRKRLNLDLDF